MTLRTGIGYDIHRLARGRKLVLGGVRIPSPLGLAGHSDADALVHALIDALLGASGGGDIGRLFPDTDPQWKDADSTALLEAVMTRLRKAGFAVVNADAVIVAEKPAIAPHVDAMKRVPLSHPRHRAGRPRHQGQDQRGPRTHRSAESRRLRRDGPDARAHDSASGKTSNVPGKGKRVLCPGSERAPARRGREIGRFVSNPRGARGDKPTWLRGGSPGTGAGGRGSCRRTAGRGIRTANPPSTPAAAASSRGMFRFPSTSIPCRSVSRLRQIVWTG